ncbi:hypothetical protein C8046_05325 [Serinibacter arcticus]|uniref:Polyketide cyclase / dehydrase and lipid transport n=1 Tax=Serinibacter arcticus TaxID=1655435 RepID=A0A2U1ZT64_9MICO|nr:SRPBCC family protein [Serinibacter arcticus]PWD50174.1 hypothetical protein C8046_05325 [Serinibacter arcticus]
MPPARRAPRGPVHELRSTWDLPVDAARAWDVLAVASRWEQWWPQVTSQVLRPGDAHGVGTRGHLVFRAPLGYRLRLGLEVTSADPPRHVVMRSVGDLVGSAVADLTEHDGGTRVVIDWRVRLTRPELVLLGRAVPVLAERSHARVMDDGERGLRAFLADG